MHALVLLIAIIGTAFFNKDEKIVEDRPNIIELINLHSGLRQAFWPIEHNTRKLARHDDFAVA